MLNRVIPILLLDKGELVKTKGFESPVYIGDVVNAVKIYNELEVDEILLFDISASLSGNEINYGLLKDLASECFVPLTYGGGINSLDSIEKLLKIGVEKIVLGSSCLDFVFVKQAVEKYGSSTISTCIDYRVVGQEDKVFIKNGTVNSGRNIEEVVAEHNQLRVGEIILQNINNDGRYSGYDLRIIKKISRLVSNSLVIAGGCAGVRDIEEAFRCGVSAAAAGSLFVYYTETKGILINYLDKSEMIQLGLWR